MLRILKNLRNFVPPARNPGFSPFSRSRNSALLALVCFSAIFSARVSLSAVIDLRPVADTTLHEVNPSINMGGHSHVAIGVTAKNTSARGLFRFDLTALPVNAVVTSARLTFTLPQLNRADPTGSLHALHRMLTPWGEGTKVGNLGSAAAAGEASWNHSANPTAWAAPGGEAGADYTMEPSARQELGPAPGDYTIDSTPALIDDLQHWIQNPAENHGWMLKHEDETDLQTARQFASRETANGAVLHIEYTAGPAPELRFTSIERAGTNIVLRWSGGDSSVKVERSIEVTGVWQEVAGGEEGAITNNIVEFHQFYRLKKD